jgi:hypothetical protein
MIFLSFRYHRILISNDILDKNIFGNSEIKFNRNPLFFQSFLRNNIFKINDIWDKNNNTFGLLLTKLSMLIIPIPPSLIFKQHTFLSIWLL